MSDEEYQNLITTKFHNILHFNYGLLDDKTYWISSVHNTLLRIDKFTLNILLSLNTGTSMHEIAEKYHMEVEEVFDIYDNLHNNGFMVEEKFGKVKRTEPTEDIDIAPYILLFLIMAIGQLFYFTRIAKTTMLNSAMEGIIIAAIAIGAIVVHELVHYFFCWGYTKVRPKMKVTMLRWIPTVYVDTNLAWKLPKNKRLLISLGGILGDLIVNTFAVIAVLGTRSLEYFVTPFLLIQYTRIAVLINPIFRGDGYWILSDLLRAVNMEKRSAEELRKGKISFFSLFGLISIIFSLFGVLGLGWFLYNILNSVIMKFVIPIFKGG